MKYEEGFSKCFEKVGNVVWLNKNSESWRNIEHYLLREVNKISEPELQEFVGCGVRFNQQHLQSVCDVIKHNSYLSIVTNSNICNLQKLKTCQALNTLGYTNSLFTGLKFLMIRRKEIRKLWPCKWSAILVFDCEGNVADILLDMLQENVDSS
jgi:hypothetical protein